MEGREATVTAARPDPLQPSGFTRLARTHALAMAGDALVTLALAGSLFFSISPTAARGRVALSLLLTMAPFAVVAPFLGPVIDGSRRGRRFAIVGTAFGRAALCVAMARVLDGLWLFPVAFAVLVLSKSYSVAKSAVVPAVVDDEASLVEANAKLSIAGVVAGFVAAVPGVVLLRLLDARWSLWLGAAVFVAAGVAALSLPSMAPPPTTPSVADDGAPGAAASAAVRRRRHAVPHSLQAAAAATALLRALVGFVTFLVAFAFRRAGGPSWWFGVVLAASMAATLAGSAVAPLLRRSLREERIVAAGLIVVSLTSFAVARASAGPLWAAAVAAAVGLAASSGKLAFDAVVQRDALDAVRGRSFARFESGFQLVWVAGSLLPVLVATPLDQGYDVMAIAAGLGAVAYLVAARRWFP